MKSESSRWYNPKTGQCVAEIMGKNGKMRKPNIKDAVAMGLLPSVTTILQVKAKPGLELWKQRNLLLSALTMPRKPGESDELFVDRLFDEADEIRSEAAETGKDFHAAAQEYWATNNEAHADTGIARFLAKLDNFRREKEAEGWGGWVAEKAYVAAMGYAGTPDLWAVRGDELLVVDYKTTDLKKYKRPWDEWAFQIAAGLHGLDSVAFTGHFGVEIVVDKTTGECKYHNWTAHELTQGWRGFQACLELWRVVNDWDARIARDE